MNIGDEILIKVKVVDLDANPHGSAVKVEVKGFIDWSGDNITLCTRGTVKFWIHRIDQPEVIVQKKE